MHISDPISTYLLLLRWFIHKFLAVTWPFLPLKPFYIIKFFSFIFQTSSKTLRPKIYWANNNNNKLHLWASLFAIQLYYAELNLAKIDARASSSSTLS